MPLGTEFDEVIAGARRADPECVARLFRDLNPRLLRYLRMKVPGEAEDLASETWIAVGRNISRFAGDEDGFRRWFFTIAHRQVTTHYRKTVRRRTDPVDNMAFEIPRRGSDASDIVNDDLVTRELFERLTAMLPGDQAEVVRLRVVGGFSMDEIGEILGKKSGTVRVLFHRALSRLAQRMPGAPGMTAAEA